jgi:release factor glutamine methyltransferase
MNKTELFESIGKELKTRLHLLDDKPEETLESTLKALWITASGVNVSAEGAIRLALPDLTGEQIEQLHKLIELRLSNIPLAYITKRQNFMGIELLSDKRALIPRKETEILGNEALNLSMQIAKARGSIKIIDACCGSGNLGLAIAFFNHSCAVYSTDLSEEAVSLTKDNISLLNLEERVQVSQGDLLNAFATDDFFGKTDMIICNPPYILSSNVQKMDSEISSNEPPLAFDGGMLGIRIIQKLISDAPRFLSHDGWLIFEVGKGQGNFIAQLCERSQFYQEIKSITDAAGNVRVIKARKAAAFSRPS